MFEPLSDREEYIAKGIVDATYAVHKALGPGLLERVYEACQEWHQENYNMIFVASCLCG
jgi:hypothetical protein